MLPFLVLFFHLFFFFIYPTTYCLPEAGSYWLTKPSSRVLSPGLLGRNSAIHHLRVGYRLAVPLAALSVKRHLLLWKGGDGWVSCKSQLLHRLKTYRFLALGCRYLPVLVPQAVQAWHPPIFLFIQWNQGRVAPNKIRCPARKQDG